MKQDILRISAVRCSPLPWELGIACVTSRWLLFFFFYPVFFFFYILTVSKNPRTRYRNGNRVAWGREFKVRIRSWPNWKVGPFRDYDHEVAGFGNKTREMLTVKFRQEPENRSIMHVGKKGLEEVGAWFLKFSYFLFSFFSLQVCYLV